MVAVLSTSTFTIDDSGTIRSYSYVPGMTWAQWANTSYCTWSEENPEYPYYVSGDNITDDFGTYLRYGNNVLVHSSDTIDNTLDYYWG